MSDPRADVLGRLGEALESLLSQLEQGAGGSATAMRAAWERCERGFGELREANEAAGGSGAPLPEGLARQLKRVQGLHAVAASVAARQKDALAGELHAARAARTRLEAVARRADPRGSCDVRG